MAGPNSCESSEMRSGVVDAVGNLHRSARADHQAVAHAVEHLEHDQCPGTLVRAAARSCRPRILAEGPAVPDVLHDFAALIDGEYRTGRQPVALSRDSGPRPGTGRLPWRRRRSAMIWPSIVAGGGMRRERQRHFAFLRRSGDRRAAPRARLR